MAQKINILKTLMRPLTFTWEFDQGAVTELIRRKTEEEDTLHRSLTDDNAARHSPGHHE